VWIIASLLASIMEAKIVVKTALHKIAQNPKASLRSLFPSIIVDYGVLECPVKRRELDKIGSKIANIIGP
jgi:hypothetical protein